jgi:histone H3/H4
MMNLRKIAIQNGIKRIGEKSLEIVKKEQMLVAKELFVQAKLLADHAGRRTVTEEDVKLALLVKQ